MKKWCKIASDLSFTQVILTKANNPNSMLHWKTSNGLDHLCSIYYLDTITSNDVEATTKFDVWEKINA